MWRRSLLLVLFLFWVAPAVFAAPAIVYTGKIKDSAYNHSLHKGIEEFQKKTGQQCFEIEGLADGSDYLEKILYCIENTYSPIILPYSGQFPELMTLVQEEKKVDFALLDFEGMALPNVWAFSFADNEGAFLAGALAALMSKTKTIGFIYTSEKYPVLLRFRTGYFLGAKYIDPNIRILESQLGNYSGAWHDVEKSRHVAKKLIEQNVDVLFSAAGYAGRGVLHQAAESGIYAIGCDVNQNFLHPGTMIGSMIKRNDKAIFIVLKLVNSEVRGNGIKRLGLTQNAMDLDFGGVKEGLVPEAVKKKIQSLKADIARGKLRIAAR